jgi:DNA-binding transcriptional ArsR family regulator
MSRTTIDPAVDRSAECAVRLIHPDAVARVETTLPSTEDIEAATTRLKLLADPTRFRILAALAREELCVCDLAAIASVDESTMSHQLRLLREHGLVAYRKDGRMAYYRLEDVGVLPLVSGALGRPTTR